MFRELLEIYQSSLVNEGAPECLFAETLIFNEGWMLRSVLKEWLTGSKRSQFRFLPFPGGVKLYSEGQLRTPFKAGYRGDPQAESHTRVDGIVGNFSIVGTKSGIGLNPDFRYVSVFEGKLYSRIARGTKNAPYYDQISRTTACIINAILQAGTGTGYRAHLAVLYPEDNRHIDPALYSTAYIENQITKRVQAFMEAGTDDGDITRFAAGWRDVLKNLQIWFVPWEEVLAEIGCDDLDRFYELCKRFNRRPTGGASAKESI